MTREEAVKRLDEQAFKELEKEPCGCIRRADAIKALEYSLSIEADGGLDKYRTVITDLLDAIYDMQKKAIEDLPSIQPKTEQRCKWIRYDYRTICPQNHEIDNPYWRIPEKRMEVLKYCPYCGKEMEVEE